MARLHGALQRHFSSLSSLAIRGLGVVAGFAVTFLIGRWYGPHASGQYAIVTQTAMFLSIIAIGGLDLAATREFSKSVVLGVRLSRVALLRVTGQAMIVALIVMAALIFAGEPVLRLLGRDSVPEGAVQVMCLILAARAFTRLTAAILRSQKDYALAQAVEIVFIPVITIALCWATDVRSVSDILWATAIAGLTTALVGIVAAARHTSAAPDSLRVSGRVLYATAIPLWGVTIAMNLADWYGLATVSATAGVREAGLFRVAAQFASAVSIITIGLFGAFSPQISAATHANDLVRVAQLARSAMWLSLVLILPCVVIGFIFAPELLRLIGPEFVEAVPLLRVLLVGQAGFAVMAIAGLVLALTGGSKTNFVISAANAAVTLIGAPLVAGVAGTFGVAVFVSATMIATNLANAVAVRRQVRIDILTGRVLPHRPAG